jgi:recombination protein RecT
MASNDVAVFENVLRPLTPHFEQALGNAMPVARLMRSIMISVERTPKLLNADRQSLLNAAMSAACLGLEVDGITGQAFFVPFAGKAQLIIGYKGMNTLAARSGYTVQGEVVREGDAFEYELGDRGFVRHKPKLGNKGDIIATWATASSLARPSIISVLGIDDVMAIMAKSPGAKMADSPWRDKNIGFPAMASKSAKRRLGRSMPLNADPRFHLAAGMEENFEERGRISWIDPQRGLQLEGQVNPDAPQIRHEQRATAELLTPLGEAITAAEWDLRLADAAKLGTTELRALWKTIPEEHRATLDPALQSRHKPTAEAADRVSA